LIEFFRPFDQSIVFIFSFGKRLLPDPVRSTICGFFDRHVEALMSSRFPCFGQFLPVFFLSSFPNANEQGPGHPNKNALGAFFFLFFPTPVIPFPFFFSFARAQIWKKQALVSSSFYPLARFSICFTSYLVTL